MKQAVTNDNLQDVFSAWLEQVKPSIERHNIMSDKALMQLFLADVLSNKKDTINDFVFLDKKAFGMPKSTECGTSISWIYFTDNAKKHDTFWTEYEKPISLSVCNKIEKTELSTI